jgi:hypothetical protein
MTPEIIAAIGLYIVLPVAAFGFLTALVYMMFKDGL